MKTAIKRIMIATLLCLLSSISQAQKYQPRKYLIVGDTLPDHTLTELVNSPNKTIRFSDFKRKWLIIDFWTHGCTACIDSYPRMDSLSQQFIDMGVQVLMVGALKVAADGSEKQGARTRDTYATINRKYKFKGTTAFDSILFLKHDIGGLPHIMVVGPDGVILTKTKHIDSLQLAQLLKGDMPTFDLCYSRSEPQPFQKYNAVLPLLTSGQEANGGIDTSYVFRSMIVPLSEKVPWRDGSYFFRPKVFKNAIKDGRLELYRYTIAQLYNKAFFGIEDWNLMDSANYQNHPLIPIIDSERLQGVDLQKQYSYSLTVPPDSSFAFVQKSMLQDLERYFGFKATLETRRMPVYFLQIKDEVKVKRILKDDGGAQFNSVPANKLWKVRNTALWSIMSVISFGVSPKIPLINMTGIGQDKKLTADIHSDMLETLEIRKALEAIGLSLNLGEKEMQVITLK